MGSSHHDLSMNSLVIKPVKKAMESDQEGLEPSQVINGSISRLTTHPEHSVIRRTTLSPRCCEEIHFLLLPQEVTERSATESQGIVAALSKDERLSKYRPAPYVLQPDQARPMEMSSPRPQRT